MPHWNMEYQVLYEDCRKVWRSKVKKKIWFAECQKMTLDKSLLCRVSGEDTRQRVNGGCRPLMAAALCRVFWFAECPTLGKPSLCRVLLFAECSALGKPPLCRVLSLWHSANSLFAECPIKSTRQSVGHSAKKPSPVVVCLDRKMNVPKNNLEKRSS